jgi:hypothetical protein
VVKRLMERAGLAGGPVRSPARNVGDEINSQLDALVASLSERGLWASRNTD